MLSPPFFNAFFKNPRCLRVRSGNVQAPGNVNRRVGFKAVLSAEGIQAPRPNLSIRARLTSQSVFLDFIGLTRNGKNDLNPIVESRKFIGGSCFEANLSQKIKTPEDSEVAS